MHAFLKTKKQTNSGASHNKLKPLSVTKNVVGLLTDDGGHVGQNSSAHVALIVDLQTDAVVVTETRFNHLRKSKINQRTLFLEYFNDNRVCYCSQNLADQLSLFLF